MNGCRNKNNRLILVLPLITVLLVLSVMVGGTLRLHGGIKLSVSPFKTGTKPNRQYALFIGIDRYERMPQLISCVSDARRLKDVLTKRYGFRDEDIMQLYDKDASYSRIISALRVLTERLTQKDDLLIYFSGHGFEDDLLGTGYLLTADTGTDIIGRKGRYLSRREISQSAYKIESTMLVGMMRNCKAQHILVLVDSSFRGFSVVNMKSGYSSSPVYEKRSRQLLAAGTGLVPDPSPFSRCIASILSENRELYLPASEMMMQLVEEIRGSGSRPLIGAVPNTGSEGGEYVFFLADEKLINIKSDYRKLRGFLDSPENTDQSKLKRCREFLYKYRKLPETGEVKEIFTAIYGYMIYLNKSPKDTSKSNSIR